MKENTLSFQILISTIDQDDYDLLEKMNIKSDAIVVNQCNKESTEEFDFNGFHIKWINMKNRGVGLSRNTALFNATADIVLWADDDMVFVDNYTEIILNEFTNDNRVDLYCFNLNILGCDGNVYGRYHTSNRRICLLNCLRYGAPNIAFRRKMVLKKNISFSLLFGGGAEFSSGEDSMFIAQCIKSGMKAKAIDKVIADVNNQESTWFAGYTDKFFIDKGRLFYLSFPRIYYLVFLYYAIKFPRALKTGNFSSVFYLFVRGKREMDEYR